MHFDFRLLAGQKSPSKSLSKPSAPGASAAQSILVVPTLRLASPPLLARQFSHLLEATQGIARPLGAVASAALAALAYLSRTSASSASLGSGEGVAQWHLFTVATLVGFSITPFTAINILPINRRMKELAEQAEKKGTIGGSLSRSEEAEAKRPVDTWRRFSYVRCLFPLFGSMIALYASVV